MTTNTERQPNVQQCQHCEHFRIEDVDTAYCENLTVPWGEGCHLPQLVEIGVGFE